MGNEELLEGFEANDDAAVFRLNDDLAGVLTVDFLTPLVDDPYDYGRVAAANALSDVYAMGARPLLALNVLALDCQLGTDVASAVLRGGADAVQEAGAIIAGGHSIDDDEPKYGLCVFGTVEPNKIVRNGGALPGDVLYLTKPLGTGTLSAAAKIGLVTEADFRVAIDSMIELNKAGAEAACASRVHAMTDVTGFGLAGHLHEMLEASGCSAELDFAALPLLPRAWELVKAYCRPNRTFSITDYAAPFVEQGKLSADEYDNRMGVICDPQTSGGLLVAIAPDDAPAFEAAFLAKAGREATRIGRCVEDASCHIRFAD